MHNTKQCYLNSLPSPPPPLKARPLDAPSISRIVILTDFYAEKYLLLTIWLICKRVETILRKKINVDINY